MKARVLYRAAGALARREEALRTRFLAPIWTINGWDEPTSVDFAASYISLLHSEAEATLENLIRGLLANARTKTERFKADPLLINCCLYYRDEMHRSLGRVELIPKRVRLEDKQTLLSSWDTFGGLKYWDNVLSENHGAGRTYVERLFHPLGIVMDKKRFARLSSSGVRALVDLSGSVATTTTEFVLLRGVAVHAGTKAFQENISGQTPSQIANRGAAVVEFAEQITRVLAKTVW